MHFCSITKRQSTKQQLPELVHKTCVHSNLAHAVFCTNTTTPPTFSHILIEQLKIRESYAIRNCRSLGSVYFIDIQNSITI